MLSKIDWLETFTHLLAAAAPFVIVLIIKFLLDLRLAQLTIKYLVIIRVRSFLRDNPPIISGQWEHEWGAAGSKSFADVRDRHSHPRIYQFGRYCYAELPSQKKKYAFYGKIKGDFWTGEWYDVADEHGYFGAFEIRIVNSTRMEGLFIGHSKTELLIRSGPTVWTKLDA